MLSVQGGTVLPFSTMKERETEGTAPSAGIRKEAFAHGFSAQVSFWPGGDDRVRPRGTLGICGMNGTAEGSRDADLQYLAYGLSAGAQVSLSSRPRGRGPYAFSELRLDWEFFKAKSPGQGWASFGLGSRRCLRLGLGAGLGWVAPRTGLTLEVEVRASLTGPISDQNPQGESAFWAELPPDRYLRLGLGWTWGRGGR